MRIILNGKTYKQDMVPVRALKEMDAAWNVYKKLVSAAADDADELTTFRDVTQTLAEWIAVLFGGQFSADDVLDGYPADQFIADAGVMIQAVVGRVTEKLDAFPTTARPPARPAKRRGVTLPAKFTNIFTTMGDIVRKRTKRTR